MSKPDFNRFNYIECPLPAQTQAHLANIVKVLEKDDFTLLDIPRKHVTYFTENNSPKKYKKPCLYDELYKPSLDYDQLLTRCDRRSQLLARKTLPIEEDERTIPVRVNSFYGHRKIDLNGEPVFNTRLESVIKEFSSRSINMNPSVGLTVKFRRFE